MSYYLSFEAVMKETVAWHSCNTTWLFLTTKEFKKRVQNK